MGNTKHRMPALTRAVVQKITEAVEELSSNHRKYAKQFIRHSSEKELTEILHAMRRWYSCQTGPIARRILKHKDLLSLAMDLSFPKGAFRGFKVDVDSSIASMSEGDRMSLPVTRNGACSSWTLSRELANRFSGASTGKVGVVIELVGGRKHADVFIAPPSLTEPWFDALYTATMGTSFRYKEHEVAIHGSPLKVRINQLKR